jgi:glucose-6-phosphate 1-dehydrogenase
MSESRLTLAKPAGPCAMVIFGAGGDLTRRLVVPSLYNLVCSRLLPEEFAIVGVDIADHSDENWRDSLRGMTEEFVKAAGNGAKLDENVWNWIASRMSYVRGDLKDPAAYVNLKTKLEQVDASYKTAGNYLFYLAVADRFFGPVVEHLGQSGLTKQDEQHWRRVVVEKPFGHDLDSAKALNKQILDVIGENQIYRIDHFLGKETVQNIMMFRFANGMFEHIWNRDRIDHIQITVAETVGVEKRGRFYEQTGALRDMVPNHVFQLLSLTAMEPPNSFGADAVRTEKDKVLEALVPMTAMEAGSNVVRGQYTAGIVRGRPVKAYREEEGVAANSMAETYVAMRLGIENWRWADVPFYLRTGKSLTRRTTEIAIQFKRVPFALFRDTPVDELTPNVLAMQIQPDEGISLQFGAKKPGQEIHLGAVRMDFKYRDYFHTEPSTGYETLIYDCMIGDAMLFQRADSVEAGWEAVQPVLDLWQKEPSTPLEFYPAGTAGPEAAEQLLLRDGRKWRPIA